MATEQGTSARRNLKKKSMARAKVKRPEAAPDKKSGGRAASAPAQASSGAKTAKSTRAGATRLQEAERKEASKDRAKKIGIAVFAVVMALSMMLPSLVTIASNMRGSETPAADAATDDSASTDDSTSADSAATDSAAADSSSADSSASASDADSATSAEASSASDADSSSSSMVTTIDENYKTEVDALKKRLDADANNLAALLNLGNQYMSWGYNVSYYASGDESASTHASELFDEAISYYDRYLALNDSNAVKVDRALCQFYGGDYTAAQEALEKLTKDAPDYGPAWANLGLVYESTFNTTSAEEAYKKAAEVDPEDEYGSKTFANQRLASMHESELTESQDVIEPSTPSTTGLSQTLADASGLSL